LLALVRSYRGTRFSFVMSIPSRIIANSLARNSTERDPSQFGQVAVHRALTNYPGHNGNKPRGASQQKTVPAVATFQTQPT
jgi:hypothetical protein